MSTSPKSSWKPQARFRRVKIRVSELEVSGSWGLWGAESLGLEGFCYKGLGSRFPKLKRWLVGVLGQLGIWGSGFRASGLKFSV